MSRPLLSRALRQRLNYPPRESGVVLLAFLLVFIVGTTFMLVVGLNESVSRVDQQEQTALALAEAKATLLVYAASYPDNVNPASGPGYLPCPDVTNDGEPRAACALATNSHVGRFPWKYLNTADLRDGSGARLWYALSDNFRYSLQLSPLNSDTPGQLVVDGNADIVAVIYAPGAPVAGQAGRAAAPNDRTNYLEDDNADADVTFVTQAAGDFNDRAMIITRAELMQAVERRVLGEAATILNNYWQDPDRDAVPGPPAFPWLSPFADPTASTFDGVAGTVEGHLPIHLAGELITTPYQATWSLPTAVTTPGGAFPPDVNCVVDNTCFGLNDAFWGIPMPAVVSAANATCNWTSRDVVNCTATTPLLAPWVRQYWFTFNDPSVIATLSPPTTVNPRMRNFNLTSPFAAALPSAIVVIDWQPGVSIAGWSTLDITTGTAGNFNLVNVPYELDVNQNEIPPWFTLNNWHHHVYIGYEARPLPATVPGDLSVCVAGADCLTVCTSGANCPADAAPPLITNARALAITAGMTLAGEDRSPAGGSLADYFDGENSIVEVLPPSIFDNQNRGPLFNDQIRVVLP